MPQIQTFDPSPVQSQAGMLGRALGTGISKNLPKPEQLVQRNLLSQAFEKMKNVKGNDLLDQFEAILPTLLTTAGGSEALSTLAPILQQRARQNLPYDAFKKDGGEEAQKAGQEGDLIERSKAEEVLPEDESENKIGQTQEVKRPEDQFRNPQPGFNPNNVYPNISAGPEFQKMLSPSEMQNSALDLMQASASTGTDMPFEKAMDIMTRQNEGARQYNDQILQQQKLRESANEKMYSGIYNRAVNSGLAQPNNPEEKTVLEKLAYIYRNEENETDQWEKVRTEFTKFANARENLRREATLPGPFAKAGRQLLGTYKDKEKVFRDLQPYLNEYRKYGLFNQARSALTGELGMGAEDAEVALFPLTENQNKTLNEIPNNKLFSGIIKGTPQIGVGNTFPGQESVLPEKDFTTFKNDLSNYLNKNKTANLIALRGKLNQDKKYAWQDVSRAVNELMEEKRFTPDNIQYEQLGVINQRPTPGLTNMFSFWWKGTK